MSVETRPEKLVTPVSDSSRRACTEHACIWFGILMHCLLHTLFRNIERAPRMDSKEKQETGPKDINSCMMSFNSNSFKLIYRSFQSTEDAYNNVIIN